MGLPIAIQYQIGVISHLATRTHHPHRCSHSIIHQALKLATDKEPGFERPDLISLAQVVQNVQMNLLVILVFLSSKGQVEGDIRIDPLLSGQMVSKGVKVTKHEVSGLDNGGGGRSVLVLHPWRKLGRTGAIEHELVERVCLERIVLMMTTSYECVRENEWLKSACVHVKETKYVSHAVAFIHICTP